jgi:aconitate hydratase
MIYDLQTEQAEREGLTHLSRLPYSIRILLESLLRQCNGREFRQEDVTNLAGWTPNPENRPAMPYSPARVIMQDFTGVPAIVDLAAMRELMARIGGDPHKINPLVPVDLVIDHSVQVDFFASSDALVKLRTGIPAEPRAVRIPTLGTECVQQLQGGATCNRDCAPGKS